MRIIIEDPTGQSVEIPGTPSTTIEDLQTQLGQLKSLSQVRNEHEIIASPNRYLPLARSARCIHSVHTCGTKWHSDGTGGRFRFSRRAASHLCLPPIGVTSLGTCFLYTGRRRGQRWPRHRPLCLRGTSPPMQRQFRPYREERHALPRAGY